MGILYAVSDSGGVDALAGELIDQRTLGLAEALAMLISITEDRGANFSAHITWVNETKVVIYYEHYIGAWNQQVTERLNALDFCSGFGYMFQRDPDDHGDTFDKFLFAVSCIVKSVPWICDSWVLRRVVGGDELAC